MSNGRIVKLLLHVIEVEKFVNVRSKSKIYLFKYRAEEETGSEKGLSKKATCRRGRVAKINKFELLYFYLWLLLGGGGL